MAFLEEGEEVAALCIDTGQLTVCSTLKAVSALDEIVLLDLALSLQPTPARLSGAGDTVFAANFCVGLIKEGARQAQERGLSGEPND